MPAPAETSPGAPAPEQRWAAQAIVGGMARTGGHRRDKTARLRTSARDARPWGGSDPPGAARFHAPGRGGGHAGGSRDGFDTIRQAATGRTVGAARAVRRCGRHIVGRRLRGTRDSSGSGTATGGLRRIAAPYAVEDDIGGTPPERRARSGPWPRGLRRTAGEMARPCRKPGHIVRHRDGPRPLLADGRVGMDGDSVENPVRLIAHAGRNALYAGRDEGAVARGRTASPARPAAPNGIKPYARLKGTPEATAAGHPSDRIDDPLPRHFASSSS